MTGEVVVDRGEVERLVAAGRSIREIAGEVGIPASTIRRRLLRWGLRSRGVVGRPPRIAPSHAPMVLAALRGGLYKYQIAQCYGVSPTAMSSYVFKYGIRV